MVPKLYFKTLNLSDGRGFTYCEYLPEAGAPAGFIAIKPGVSGRIEANLIHFVKVSNIVSFSVDEKDLKLVWGLFDTVPETVKVLRSID